MNKVAMVPGGMEILLVPVIVHCFGLFTITSISQRSLFPSSDEMEGE
jgi:hypothetical protein